MTEKQLREKVVNTAVAWLGCKEADGSHRKIIDTYNSHKPLARGYAVKYTDAWCSTFVSAVAIAAEVTDILPTECGCEKHTELFKALGRWMENDAYVPAVGDVIFYDWQDTGAGDTTGYADHVGIVASVSGGMMKIIEGNISNAVGYRNIAVNAKYIRGYGIPDYAKKATGAEETEKATIYKVVAGDNLTKIAKANGTTVQTLAKANAIKNVNVIRVGTVLMLEATTAAAVDKLATLGVINSPDFWKAQAEKVKYLPELLMRSAQVIKKAKARTATPEKGVEALVKAGVIETPEYWLKIMDTTTNLPALLRALGGSV